MYSFNKHSIIAQLKKRCRVYAKGGGGDATSVKMFKRPLPRPTCVAAVRPPTVFASVITKMRTLSVVHPKPPAWTPPVDYEFVANHLSVAERGAFIRRCEEWFAAQPPRVVREEVAGPVIDVEPILDCLEKHRPHRPPHAEYLEAVRKAGYPNAKLERVDAHYRWMEDTYDERTAKLDLVFAKWPAANKPTPVKTKPKVIKAVKKKMG